MIHNLFLLLRVKHYIKNFLIFFPLFFSINFFDVKLLCITVISFICFSLQASVIYIINDIRDIEKDRLHTTKSKRPLASGVISVKSAIYILIFLLIVILFIFFLLAVYFQVNIFLPLSIVLLYFLLNVAYSFGLKNIPIIDVVILASGFVLRVLFGAAIIHIDISVWLYLTITAGSLYLGLGKRRNELMNEINTRTVLRFYTHNFLDKNMYMCQTLCIVFYSLWSIDPQTILKLGSDGFVFTIPIVLLILLKYNLNIEKDSDGDPASVILGDKILLALIFVYAFIAFFIVYFLRTIS